ncbi:T9SS type A sorting domain-containing protein [Ancylomarina sp. DW003]|nr:LamG-like jellyroll fold domain-containing protein [Ancylomarina sp. DW003]MDE5421970.1 T9SS type A sorting domain-containing protein [Ancylomarina sp. DW003]
MKKKLLLLLIALSSINLCYSQTHRFSSSRWSIEEEKSCDGSISIQLIRHWGGHTWGNQQDLYLQYQNQSGQWKDVCYIHHFFDNGNKYQAYSSGLSCSFENRNPSMGYDYYAYKIKIRYPPNPNQRVAYRWIQKSNGDYLSDTKYATAYKPNAVQNFTTSKNEGCGTVKLRWERPSNVDASSSVNYYVYRRTKGYQYGSYITSTSSYNYTDNYASKTTKNEYQIRAIVNCGSDSNYGEYSQWVEGYGKQPIAPPNNFTVTTSCEKKVDITWNPNMEQPNIYQIQYANNSQFSNASTKEISGSRNSTEITLPDAFITYHFRIRTKNSCNIYGAWSPIEEEKSSDLPDAVNQLTYTLEGNSFHFSWDDVANEEEYVLERINVNDQSDIVEFKIDKDVTEYIDDTPQFCTSYRYSIYSKTQCGSTKTPMPDVLTLTPDLSNYLTNFEISKGYHSNRVELKWEINSNRQISEIRIYRSVEGQGNPEVVEVLEPNQIRWTDYKIDPNILYQYQIKGIQNCGEETVYTNILSDVGFRTPFGTILGSVSFDGGNPVENTEILVDGKSDLQTNKSVHLKPNAYISIPKSESLKDLNEISAQLWVKPDNNNLASAIIYHFDSAKTEGYYLTLINNLINVTYFTNKTMKGTQVPFVLPSDEFTNIGLTISSSELKVYINGERKINETLNSPIQIPNTDILINVNNPNSICIDEFTLFKNAKSDEEVRRDYNRKLDAKEKDMVVYLQMDENVGDYVYDSSNNGHEYNKNHASINGTFEWSDIAPSSSQLGYKGITDANGNYAVPFIRYSGNGQIFEVTPVKNIHQFQPAVQTCFIGEGSENAEKNFKDISSFKVTGNVLYTLDQSNCPAEGIQLLIDGNVVTQNGKPVKTDQNGEFEIQVPIGKHIVSVQKEGHTFESSTYPSNGEPYDFREEISGIEFKNTTVIKVAGRVVGGTREGEKPIGFGLSQNNIGLATLTFKSENQCFEKSITNNPETGEYEIELLPVNFIVSSLTVDNNDVFFKPEEYADVLNLADYVLEKEEINQAKDKQNEPVTEDQKYKYNCKKIFTYRATPSVNVSLSNDAEFKGEESLEYITNQQTGESVTLDLSNKPFAYPVLKCNGEYNLKISAYEEYKNLKANPVIIDRVPVTDGKITISNDLGDSKEIENEGNSEIIQLNNEKGVVAYKFIAGEPILTEDEINPEKSFTASLKVSLEAGGNLAEWKPNNGNYFRAYLLGQKKKGNSFLTTGPQNVKWILRDPPGSSSHSFLSEGTTLTDVEQMSFHENLQNDLVLSFDLGSNIIVGGGIIGPQIQTEIRNTLEWKNTFQQSAGRNNTVETTVTFGQDLSTSSDNNIVGADMDLFIGYAQNIIYGESESFNLVPSSTVNQHSLSGPSHEVTIGGIKYKLAISPAFYMNPNGFETMFIYTQKHIEERIIPDLITVRDGLFERDNSPYTSKIGKSNPLYGSNNDDLKWSDQASTDDPKTTELADFDGSSYTYDHASHPNEPDSIRWYNQQIRLWKGAIKNNEKEKIETTKFYDRNISFVGGGQSYAYSKTSTTTKTKEEYFDITLATEFANKFGAWFNSTGTANTNTVSLSMGGGNTYTDIETTTNTFGYSFSDPDVGDAYSVDVLDPESGNGPIFKLRAGQSACPFEPALTSKYYNPGTEITPATKQREKIKLNTVSNDIVSNIPSHRVANFTLNLINESETGDASWFGLRVVEGSNPNGATIKVNGAPIKTYVEELQPGITTQVQLTLNKNQEYDDYDNIKIMAYSECEFDNYHNYGKIYVADTINLSAYFIPSCGDINIVSPQNNWIVNRDKNNHMEILVEGISSIAESFDNFIIQYRTKGQTNWINLQKFLVNYDAETADANEQAIPSGVNSLKYDWNTNQITEGNYELRILSTCQAGITNESEILTGTIDREAPVIFTAPEPILSANQVIRYRFNEDLKTELINNLNVDIRGVLNGAPINHNVSAYFDGINNNVLIRTNGREYDQSFMVEMWAKRENSGYQVVLGQGSGSDNEFELAFNNNNEFIAKYAGKELVKTSNVPVNEWFHYAISYDANSKLINLFQNGKDIDRQIMDNKLVRIGDIRLGKGSQTNQNLFKGNLHELRLWSKSCSRAEIARNMSSRLSGNEISLMGLWRFDEGIGEISLDQVQGNHAIFNADWSITPKGKSIHFSNNSFLEVAAGDLAFANDEKFTIEFWMNTDSKTPSYLFSNGNGLNSENSHAWSVGLNSNGDLIVENAGASYATNNLVLTDGNWHHIAISVNRPGASNVFVDNGLALTIPSANLGGLGGAKMWFGAKGEISSTGVETVQSHYSGLIDDFRIWAYNKKQKLIERDQYIRLNTTEPGLVFYLPLETYQFDMGVANLTGSIEDKSESELQITNRGASLNSNTPSIKLSRPIEKVNFTLQKSEREIAILLTDDMARIEKTTLDVAITNIYDKFNNKILSPEVYSIFINQNQLKWEQEKLEVKSKKGETTQFKVNIVNSGVASQTYSINNLPAWLDASPKTGTIGGNSSIEINFNVHEGLNTGYYNEQFYLTGDGNFNEPFYLDLCIEGKKPNWEDNTINSQFAMNIIGEIIDGGMSSSDENDMVAAYVGNELRGFGKLRYLKQYDKYLVFLNVGSDNASGDVLNFKVWKANTGIVHSISDVSMNFSSDKIKGSIQSPVSFTIGDPVERDIDLSKGWNWISMNLVPDDLTINSVFSNMETSEDDRIISPADFYIYKDNSWITSDGATKDEINSHFLYKVFVAKSTALHITGIPVDYANEAIDITTGWNWIGYLPQFNLEINEALSDFNASDNDEIKTNGLFARYDAVTSKWYGSLTHMKPGEGYLLKSIANGSFRYPERSMLSNSTKSGKHETETPVEKCRMLYKTENNMSVVARLVDQQGTPVNAKNIAAWSGDKPLSVAEKISELNSNQVFYCLSIPVDDEIEEVRFTYEDESGVSKSIITTVTSEMNASLGELRNPKLLEVVSNEESKLKVYPNPFSEHFSVEIMVQERQNVKIEIINLMGQTLISRSKDFDAGKQILTFSQEVQQLPAGIYIVKITKDDGIFHHKVVKK